MEVDYRLMRDDETPAVIRFWCQVFDMPEAYMVAKMATDPAACDHTYIAALPDGAIVSTLHYFLSRRRDAEGLPRLLVGEIDSVVTRPDARRQGHAERLLRMAIAALEREGCDWSLLVSTDMARPLYERHGWRCYPEPWRQGSVTDEAMSTSATHLVRPFDPRSEPDGWERIATVDMAFNQARPLTVVRDPAYWRDYAALRIGNWMTTEDLMIFAAFNSADDPQPCGYALAEFYPDALFQIRDLGVLPTESAAISALLNAVAQEARRKGVPPVGRIYLPYEPAIDAALAHLFGGTLQYGQDQGHLMARPIRVQFIQQQLDALFVAPGASFSCIDLF
jgi:GNAT superfamily N-acetyltransferase